MRDVVGRPKAAALGLILAVLVTGLAQPSVARADEIYGFDRFMYALGQVESGGRYDAYNSSSGAYGKYQIIPSSWAAWAEQVLGDADAPMTPENQERVARYKVHEARHRYGSWSAVAYWWLTGTYRDPSLWSDFAQYYVNKVMTVYRSTTDGTATTTTRIVTRQESWEYNSWSGTWGRATHPLYSGGWVRYSNHAGDTFRFPFVGRSVAWMGPKGPTRGKARIYIDGTYVRTVDLYASSYRAVNTVWSRSWTDSAKHVLVIKVVGTAGRPTVAIDAFRVGK